MSSKENEPGHLYIEKRDNGNYDVLYTLANGDYIYLAKNDRITTKSEVCTDASNVYNRNLSEYTGHIWKGDILELLDTVISS